MNWLVANINDILEQEYNDIYLTLTPSRKKHIENMKQQETKKRSLLATYLLKCLLKEAGRADLNVETAENGKPYLNDSDLFISISHSNDMVACALSENAVGIDIEKIRPVKRKLIEYACTDSEKDFIFQNEKDFEKEIFDGETARRFFEVWTAKEAFFKKNNKDVKNLLSIDTVNLKRKVYVIDDYYITIA